MQGCKCHHCPVQSLSSAAPPSPLPHHHPINQPVSPPFAPTPTQPPINQSPSQGEPQPHHLFPTSLCHQCHSHVDPSPPHPPLSNTHTTIPLLLHATVVYRCTKLPPWTIWNSEAIPWVFKIIFLNFSCCLLLLYNAILCSRADHCARMWFYVSEQLFIARFWISTEVVCLQRWHGWCHMKLLPSRRVLCTVYTIQPCTMSLHAKPHT